MAPRQLRWLVSDRFPFRLDGLFRGLHLGLKVGDRRGRNAVGRHPGSVRLLHIFLWKRSLPVCSGSSNSEAPAKELTQPRPVASALEAARPRPRPRSFLRALPPWGCCQPGRALLVGSSLSVSSHGLSSVIPLVLCPNVPNNTGHINTPPLTSS